MMNTTQRFCVAAALPALFAFVASVAPAVDVAPSDKGVTILRQGPVHEAFARPLEPTPKPGLLVPRQPPDPIPEAPPDKKPTDPNARWIPGYWAWDPEKGDYIWVSGCWRVPPPGRRWVPGYWVETDAGWQWANGFWTSATSSEIEYLGPPPAANDPGPTTGSPEPGSTWVPGIWVYQDGSFVWQPGYWLTPQPNWTWNPSEYFWTPGGYVFQDGFWDYPLDDRGLLFAPIVLNTPTWQYPGYYYRPWYTVGLGSLLPSLFLQPSYGHYYFGNFHGNRYARLGMQPWYSYGNRFYDPLFSYYWGVNRGDPAWYRGVRDRFVARQQPLGSSATSSDPLGVLTPLDRIQPTRGGGLATMLPPQLATQRAGAQRLQTLSTQRRDAEKPLAARTVKGGVVGRVRLPADDSVNSIVGVGSGRQANYPASSVTNLSVPLNALGGMPGFAGGTPSSSALPPAPSGALGGASLQPTQVAPTTFSYPGGSVTWTRNPVALPAIPGRAGGLVIPVTPKVVNPSPVGGLARPPAILTSPQGPPNRGGGPPQPAPSGGVRSGGSNKSGGRSNPRR